MLLTGILFYPSQQNIQNGAVYVFEDETVPSLDFYEKSQKSDDIYLAVSTSTEKNEMQFENQLVYEYAIWIDDQNLSIFAVYPFYLAENSQIYYYFQADNPDMSAETVVWKVNASLHLPFYTDIQTNYASNPLLVNPFNRLPFGFIPYELIPVHDGNNYLLATPETVLAFRRMNESAINYGFNLIVTSAFRNAERQRILFEQRRREGAVARPYHSEHQTGRALDLINPRTRRLLSAHDPESMWLLANAHRYGFIIRYKAETTHITGFIHEPWHVTYVGISTAQYMYDNDILSLEEFVGRNPHALLANYAAIYHPYQLGADDMVSSAPY